MWEYITYTVAFDANGGTGAMDAVTVNDGKALTLPECAFAAPAHKRFKAWSINGTEYAVGAKLTPTADVTVTAVWEQITYKVTYKANGGSGTMRSVTVNDGDSLTLPACTFKAPANKRFKAWSVGGKEYAPGEVITPTANTTVKAVWEIEPSVSASLSGSQLSYKIYAPGGSQLIAASYDGNGRLLSVSMVAIDKDFAGTEGVITLPEGAEYKLMLVDRNNAPLCAAWTIKN